VTFLFTDIEGSTARWERDQVAMREVLAAHDATLRRVIIESGGVVVKHTGDGVMAVFRRPNDAIRAAVDAQRSIEELEVRIGVHAGTSEPDYGGDYLGPAPNRAARVMDAAHGGQILVSGAVAALASDDLPPGVSLRDLGEHPLRSLERPEHLWQVCHPALGGDFAAPRTPTAAAGNLPELRTTVLGRREEAAQLGVLLDRHRIVTITGAGGVGKTTLAQVVAAARRPPDGSWFVDLVPVSADDDVVGALADAFRLRQRDGQTLARSVFDALSVRHALVVIDNCEHVLGAVAPLVDRLIGAAPHVTVLATSREALGVPGEQQLPLSPLASGTDGAAMQLFVERARSVRPGIEFDSGDRAAIATICERLDGIPLAIELAAARVRSLAPRDLATRLDERLRLLRTTGRTTGTHHDTLEATIGWSYELLAEPERRLFECLAVFPTSFDAEAVAAVAPDLVADEVDALDVLDRLAGKSLLVVDGSARFRLFSSVQAFAAARLAERGGMEAAKRQHAAHYLELAVRLAPLIFTEPGTEALDRLDAEYSNLGQTLDWSAEHDPRMAIEVAFAVHHTWLSRSHGAELEQRLLELLDKIPNLDTPTRAKALWCAGGGRFFRGDTRGTRPLWKEAVAGLPRDDPEFAQLSALLAQLALFDGDLDDTRRYLALAAVTIPTTGVPYHRLAAYSQIASTAAWMGDLEQSERALDAALANRAGVSPVRTAPYLTSLSSALRVLDPPRALELLDEALDLCAIARDPWAEAVVTMHLGYSLLANRRGREGCATLSRSLPLLLATGARRDAMLALEALAGALRREGEPEAAVLAYAAAASIRDDLDIGRLPGEQERRDRRILELRDRLGDEAFAAIWQAGQHTGVDEVCQRLERSVGRLGDPDAAGVRS
jgi:predicted ATPase